MYTRVLFLDVDGVLNSSTLEKSNEHAISLCGGDLLIDKRALCRLEGILRKTGACIVLSTSWRSEPDAVLALKDACADVGIPEGVFLGQTPEFRRPHLGLKVSRVAEIHHWLSMHRVKFGVEAWVALDDMDLAGACNHPSAGIGADSAAWRMVRTDPHVGLQNEQLQLALGVLGFPSAIPRPATRALGSKSRKGIVLDIDGTLIDSLTDVDIEKGLSGRLQPTYITSEGDAIFARPHLQSFLDFCFDHFLGVGIWTAASRDWAEVVVAHVLGNHRPWAFVWSSERLLTGPGSVKPLRKLWKSASRRLQGFQRHSTIIIEDTPKNCVHNYGNSVFVDSFDVTCSDAANDNSLLQLINYLGSEVLPLASIRDRWHGRGLRKAPPSPREICLVCDGTKLLLSDPCPLCCDKA